MKDYLQEIQQTVEHEISLDLCEELEILEQQAATWQPQTGKEKSSVVIPTSCIIEKEIFHSPLNVYFYVSKMEKPPFTMYEMQQFWKRLQTEASLKFHTQRDRRLYQQTNFWRILTEPDAIKEDVMRAVQHYQGKGNESHSLSVEKSKVCPPLKLSRLSWNQQGYAPLNAKITDDQEMHQMWVRLYKPQRNAFLVKPISTLEDFLMDDKGVQQLARWLKKDFQQPNPFFKMGAFTGPPGIGKNTLVRFLIDEMCREASWISMADARGQSPFELFRSKLESHKLSFQGETRQTSQCDSIFVLYDCDYADGSTKNDLRKIWNFVKSKVEMPKKNKATPPKKKLPWTRQVLVLLIATNPEGGAVGSIIKSLGKGNHIKVYPKSSEHFYHFYQSVRSAIQQKTGEPLELESFPERAQSNWNIRNLCDSRDVRALLHSLSFLWVTMDAMRTFDTLENSGLATWDKTTASARHTTIAIGCYDVVEPMVLRHEVPISFYRHQRERYSVEEVVGLKSVSVGYPPRKLYKWATSRDVDILPDMILYNVFPYLFDFRDGDIMFATLLPQWLLPLSPPEQQATEEKGVSLHSLNTFTLSSERIEKHLCEVFQALVEFDAYRQEIDDAGDFLLQQLVDEASVYSRRERKFPFKTLYPSHLRVTKQTGKEWLQQTHSWKSSLPPSQNIAFFSMSQEMLTSCYETEIRSFDEVETLKVTKQKGVTKASKSKQDKFIMQKKKNQEPQTAVQEEAAEVDPEERSQICDLVEKKLSGKPKKSRVSARKSIQPALKQKRKRKMTEENTSVSPGEKKRKRNSSKTSKPRSKKKRKQEEEAIEIKEDSGESSSKANSKASMRAKKKKEKNLNRITNYFAALEGLTSDANQEARNKKTFLTN